MICAFSVCAFGAKIKIINYLNLIKIPQKPDFAESEESDDKTKEQTQFVLSLSRLSEPVTLDFISLLNRYAPYKSCYGVGAKLFASIFLKSRI